MLRKLLPPRTIRVCPAFMDEWSIFGSGCDEEVLTFVESLFK
jgi:hypothetical protein